MKTLRLKVKREAYPWLNKAAKEVNFVWNYCNQTSADASTRSDKLRKWLTHFDLCKLTSGATELFSRIASGTIECVCKEFTQKRRAAKKLKLRWRASGGRGRSLGWVPFRAENMKMKGLCFKFCAKRFRVFEPELVIGKTWKQGCFAQDSCGDWWLCLPIEEEVTNVPALRDAVGIDLGLKSLATMSDGSVAEAIRFFQTSEQKIAQAQRRGHMRQLKRLHRKVKRQRHDSIHKLSRMIVNKYQNIFIGDVSSSKLKRTRMAKSVSNAAWTTLRTQLQYKGQQAGRRVEIVNEAYTTRACSSCGLLSGPGGLRQLVVRRWTCECGVTHDRDVNAARNILSVGLRYAASVGGNEQRKTHGYRTPTRLAS